MPSIKKILFFLFSAMVTALAVGVLGYSMSINWATANMDCGGGSGFLNGTAVVTLELFHGSLVRTFCPTFGDRDNFEVIPELVKIGAAPVALHALVLCLLVLCLVCSAASILISLYNSVSNPYETYMGPVGVYTCSSISACVSIVAIIIFVANVNLTNMAEGLVANFAGTNELELRNKASDMGLGYYLVILYAVLSLISIVFIYIYDHAAYTHRREQQKPTEDAPKEIMMY